MVTFRSTNHCKSSSHILLFLLNEKRPCPQEHGCGCQWQLIIHSPGKKEEMGGMTLPCLLPLTSPSFSGSSLPDQCNWRKMCQFLFFFQKAASQLGDDYTMSSFFFMPHTNWVHTHTYTHTGTPELPFMVSPLLWSSVNSIINWTELADWTGWHSSRMTRISLPILLTHPLSQVHPSLFTAQRQSSIKRPSFLPPFLPFLSINLFSFILTVYTLSRSFSSSLLFFYFPSAFPPTFDIFHF